MQKPRKTKTELMQELQAEVMRILDQYEQIDKEISDILKRYPVGQRPIQPPRIDIIEAVYSRIPRDLKIEFLRWLLREYQLANAAMLLGFISGFEDAIFIESILKSSGIQKKQ